MSKIAITLFGGSQVEGYSAPVGTHWRFSLAGGDKLDLRRADLPQDHTVQFRFATLFGECKIRVPQGTKVDLGGFVLIRRQQLEGAAWRRRDEQQRLDPVLRIGRWSQRRKRLAKAIASEPCREAALGYVPGLGRATRADRRAG